MTENEMYDIGENRRVGTENRSSYSTLDLKLAALLLAELPDSVADVSSNGNSYKKLIRITFPEECQGDLNVIISDYINREARANVSRYNRGLNTIRDKLKVVSNQVI